MMWLWSMEADHLSLCVGSSIGHGQAPGMVVVEAVVEVAVVGHQRGNDGQEEVAVVVMVVSLRNPIIWRKSVMSSCSL